MHLADRHEGEILVKPSNRYDVEADDWATADKMEANWRSSQPD